MYTENMLAFTNSVPTKGTAEKRYAEKKLAKDIDKVGYIPVGIFKRYNYGCAKSLHVMRFDVKTISSSSYVIYM
jgi:hypothetical protein